MTNHSRKLLDLSQETYIKKILERFQMHNFKLIDTLIAKGKCSSIETCLKTLKQKDHITNISYSKPSLSYGKTIKRILCYLRGIGNYMLCYHC